jgi:hypothetical protein
MRDRKRKRKRGEWEAVLDISHGTIIEVAWKKEMDDIGWDDIKTWKTKVGHNENNGQMRQESTRLQMPTYNK